MLAAALAYYTIFSLAPLLLIVIGLLGLVYGQGDAQQQLIDQISGVVGENAAGMIQTMLKGASSVGAGLLSTIIGFVILIVGATGVLVQLQQALNLIWGVKPNPQRSGVMQLIMSRLLSLGMLLAIGFLLLVSLVISALLAGLQGYLNKLLPGADLWQIIHFLISFAVITVFFAMIYKYLPDTAIPWRAVWIGAAFTSLLFVIGKFLLGLYLGNSAVASAYGAAGSLVVLLLWIYYSAQILLFGAEFIKVYGSLLDEKVEAAS